MGIHLGTSYITVIAKDVTQCVLGIVTHYPSYSDPNSFEPFIDDAYTQRGEVSVFDSETKARIHLKRHILLATHTEIMSHIYVIEDAKLDLQSYKFELKALNRAELGDSMYDENVAYYERKIIHTNDLIIEAKAKLSELRKMRTKRPKLTFARDLT